MTLHQQIREQIKDAMRSKDAIRLQTLRGLLSQCTNELLNLKRTPQDELSDEEVLAVIRRAVKQRKDSIEQFMAGGRPELAEDEKAELVILEAYLPALMSEEDVQKIASAKKAEFGALDKSKMGQFMGALMKELKGKADGDVVKKVVESMLD